MSILGWIFASAFVAFGIFWFVMGLLWIKDFNFSKNP
jgi:hypothetical protein